jgi:molecular chaperone IbpA
MDDFTPFYRSTVGFDRMLDLLGAMSQPLAEDAWPPYDIERIGEDRYRITMAVAGFAPHDLSIMAERNTLTVEGRKAEPDDGRNYLHRGIAQRAFRRQFELADFVEVESAAHENGLLSIELKRELPEAMKPRRIEIGAQSAGQRRDQRRLERASA